MCICIYGQRDVEFLLFPFDTILTGRRRRRPGLRVRLTAGQREVRKR